MIHWLCERAREPLLHFLLLGAGLFLLHGWVGSSAAGEGEQIVISEGRVAQLALGFQRMHQRAPDPGELDALIDDAVREEIYYRAAKALELDRDDTIVRRRLRQKLEFLSEDVTPLPEPTQAELQAHLLRHPERFRTERRYSLSQIYLDPQRHGARLARDAARLLAECTRRGPDADPGGRGDPALLPQRFEQVSANELSRLFGAQFEGALATLPVGTWAGPVPSGVGLHLVSVRERLEERPASLAEAADEVRRDWVQSQRAEANARFYAELRERYVVSIARPPASEQTAGIAAGSWP
jgi:hypothetical protein